MKVRPRLLVPFYGCLWGWLMTLLVARAGVIAFSASRPAPFFNNYCTWIGYAKAADYVWPAIMFCAGLIGSAMFDLAWRHGLGRSFALRNPSGALLVAKLSLGSSFALGLSALPGSKPYSWLLAGFAGFFPWLGRSWHRREETPVADVPRELVPGNTWRGLACMLCALVWMHDPAWRSREIDTVHEGVHLLYAQQTLRGERLGVDFHVEYGPLYTSSVIWWLRATAMTVEQQRRYFQAAQVLGTFLCLMTIAWVVPGWPVILATMAAMLGLTTSSAAGLFYGWPNTLRPGLALAALVTGWIGLERKDHGRLRLSGVLMALSLLYSSEFGCSAAAAVFALVLAMAQDQARWKSLGVLLTAAGLTGMVLWLSMFGLQSLSAAGTWLNGYALARLGGHMARPFPRFEWWHSLFFALHHMDDYLVQCSLWWPLAIACLSAMWLSWTGFADWNAEDRLVFSLVICSLFFQVPALVRPMGSQLASAPPAILLGGILLARLRRRTRPGFTVAAVCVLALALANPDANLMAGFNRMSARCPSKRAGDAAIARIGDLDLPAAHAYFLHEAIAAIHRRCPPGDRMFLAAPLNLIIPFLADRATVAPWPDPVLATTRQASASVLEALERVRPPLALVGEWVDIPLPVEHPEFWKYIETHYRFDGRVGGLMFYVRNPGQTPDAAHRRSLSRKTDPRIAALRERGMNASRLPRDFQEAIEGDVRPVVSALVQPLGVMSQKVSTEAP